MASVASRVNTVRSTLSRLTRCSASESETGRVTFKNNDGMHEGLEAVMTVKIVDHDSAKLMDMSVLSEVTKDDAQL